MDSAPTKILKQFHCHILFGVRISLENNCFEGVECKTSYQYIGVLENAISYEHFSSKDNKWKIHFDEKDASMEIRSQVFGEMAAAEN